MILKAGFIHPPFVQICNVRFDARIEFFIQFQTIF